MSKIAEVLNEVESDCCTQATFEGDDDGAGTLTITRDGKTLTFTTTAGTVQ